MSEIKKLENISHLKLVSVQFRKHFKGPSFSGGWMKLLKTFTRQFFFNSRFQKHVLASLLIFSSVCY